MSETTKPLGVGDMVPDFKLTTFEPSKKGFGEYSLGETKKAKQWSVLFFYPADFTFV